MKIGIGTDFHLGLRQYGLTEREEDFYTQYNTMIDIFIKEKVDMVIMGGDIFDQARPSPKAMDVFTKGLQNLVGHQIDVINVIGNHAMIQAKGFVTADEYIFGNTVLATLLNNKTFMKKDDVAIFGLPFYFNYDLNNFIKDVNELNDIAKDCDKSILVLHQSFKEFCGFTGESLSINDIDTSNFDLIICGHIHERKLTDLDDGTIFLQPGSLERSNVAEARDEEVNGKGVYIIDTDKMDLESVANSFCRIKSPRPFLIADMYIGEKSEVDEMKEEILTDARKYSEPPVLFLTVHDTSNSFHRITEITKEFKSDFLTVRLSYFDESQEQIDLILDTKDVPTARGVLKLALNPLSEEQAQLGLDIFDNLKDGKDISGLLNDFYNKNYPKKDASEDLPQDNFDSFEEWLNQ